MLFYSTLSAILANNLKQLTSQHRSSVDTDTTHNDSSTAHSVFASSFHHIPSQHSQSTFEPFCTRVELRLELRKCPHLVSLVTCTSKHYLMCHSSQNSSLIHDCLSLFALMTSEVAGRVFGLEEEESELVPKRDLSSSSFPETRSDSLLRHPHLQIHQDSSSDGRALGRRLPAVMRALHYDSQSLLDIMALVGSYVAWIVGMPSTKHLARNNPPLRLLWDNNVVPRNHSTGSS